VRACAHCRRFLDQVRTEKKIKSDQARRQEAEREWKATEEAEHQRRKIKAYYRAEDLATLDDPAVGRRSSGRAKIRGLKLDVDAAAMASEDEDGPSARSGLRSNEVELADGARRGGGRPQKGQDSRERDEATSPAQDEATARDPPREVDAGRDALSKDEIAAALSKIRHRRYLAVKEFLDAGRVQVQNRDEFVWQLCVCVCIHTCICICICICIYIYIFIYMCVYARACA
jgi:hypothetical protein